MSTIGNRIKLKRKELGLTQAELGEKLNITDRAVSKWEQGEGDPNLSIIPNIAKVLGVSLDYLLLGKEEEPAITLDDMDAEKRLSLLIKKDDVKNFKKYEYQNSAYVFGRSMCYRSREQFREPIKKTWEEIFSEKAKKIFGVCCDEIIKMNSKKVRAAFLVYDFIDEFVKMAVDCDRPDVLETIGFKIFAIGNKPANIKEEMPFMHNQSALHYVSTVDTYFIKEETFNYIFENREKAPNCYEYATTLELKYTYTHLHDAIVRFAIRFGYFDTLDKLLASYRAELNSESLPKNEYNGYNGSYGASWINTYVISGERVVGRIYYFQRDAIDTLLNDGKVEYAKKLNDYNAEAVKRLKELNFRNEREIDKIYHLSESEFDRAVKLNGDLSDNERTYLLCINDKLLVPSEIRKLRDLKVVRDILNKGYYNYYEFAFDALTSGRVGELFRFFVDYELEGLATEVLAGKENYAHLLSSIWTEFNLKQGYVGKKNYDDMKNLIGKQNPLSIDKYNRFQFEGKSYDISSEAKKLEENKLIEYIKSLKEAIYTGVSNDIDTENKIKQDAIDRAKAVKGLTKDYFEGLISKKGLFTEKEQRLFILDLCSLLDAILKFDYHCEGEDLFERMTTYFKALQDNAPQSRTMDDGWGYQVEDTQYDEEVVIPERKRIEHLVNIFSRLRIQRNNIAHSESKKVEELNETEMRECLEYVFSINKEAK
ncbi:MAG: helix-turn-helix transcriptional regulator [Bacilli bacterium]|nr:helix-turn-helix transcriptional regulator [Bacilli bacterium]